MKIHTLVVAVCGILILDLSKTSLAHEVNGTTIQHEYFDNETNTYVYENPIWRGSVLQEELTENFSVLVIENIPTMQHFTLQIENNGGTTPVIAAIETLDRCDRELIIVTTREFHFSQWEAPVFIYFRYIFSPQGNLINSFQDNKSMLSGGILPARLVIAENCNNQ